MARDPKTKEQWLHWEQDGKQGGFRVKLGTLQFLGIDLGSLTVGETDVEVRVATYQRRLYAGGPLRTVTRKAAVGTKTKRIMVGMVTSAKSGDQMMLTTSEGQRDTIRVTGDKRAFSKWLKEKSKIAASNVTVLLENGNGTDYVVLNEKTTA